MAQHKHKIMNIEEGDSRIFRHYGSANMEVIIANTLMKVVALAHILFQITRRFMLQVMVV